MARLLCSPYQLQFQRWCTHCTHCYAPQAPPQPPCSPPCPAVPNTAPRLHRRPPPHLPLRRGAPHPPTAPPPHPPTPPPSRSLLPSAQPTPACCQQARRAPCLLRRPISGRLLCAPHRVHGSGHSMFHATLDGLQQGVEWRWVGGWWQGAGHGVHQAMRQRWNSWHQQPTVEDTRREQQVTTPSTQRWADTCPPPQARQQREHSKHSMTRWHCHVSSACHVSGSACRPAHLCHASHGVQRPAHRALAPCLLLLIPPRLCLLKHLQHTQ